MVLPSQKRLLSVVSALVTFTALALYLTFWPPALLHSPGVDVLTHTDVPLFRAPRSNPWTELSLAEASDIYDYLYYQHPELNLTHAPRTGLENHINFIETLRPNKSDALPFLAGDAEHPQRWAKAAVSQLIDHESYVSYFAIGPLPVSAATELLPLRWCFASGRNYVNNPVISYQRFQAWGRQVAANVSDITLELLDAAVEIQIDGAPTSPDSLSTTARPVWIENGTIEYWMGFQRPGPHSSAWSILPQGLYVKVQTSHHESVEWQIVQWYYNNVMYRTADELRAAMRDPGFVKAPPNLDGQWTDIEDYESKPPGRDMAPPIMVQPHGARYRLDRQQNYISWMGFEFYIASSQSTGPALFDIRFNGEQVMYELGLQEAMAHYAGGDSDPIQGAQEYLDTFFGMGKFSFELVRGYDCPAYADYLSTTYHVAQKPWTNANSICIFEYTSDALLQRHTSQYQTSVSRNQYLVVRSVATVGNYDYTFDYIFYLDGTIEVKVRASGFIFASFFNARAASEGDYYGYRIHDAAATSMHDHVINFKADIDVAGVSNDFVRIAVEPTQRSYPWEQPEVPVRNTMVLNNYPVTEETGLDWPKNSGQMYAIYHANKTNKWGERRGYRITPGTGMGTPPHLTILNSTTLGKSARWSEHDLWVLRNKETELSSGDPLNYLDPHDPMVDFERLANGESLLHVNASSHENYKGDLVLYFNLGAHHVPHSGDIPNTLMHTSASSVMFVPHNFADRDPSRHTAQGVRLGLKGHNGAGWLNEKGKEKKEADEVAADGDLRRGKNRLERGEMDTRMAKPRYFGATYESGFAVNKEDVAPDLSGYDSAQNAVTDLGFNGSLLGTWFREGA